MAEQKRRHEAEGGAAAAEEGRELYTIPARSSWFRWDEIHETERRALGEFFDSTSISKNPRAYKEYRDFIINKYREDPSRRITFTEIRNSLIGDVGALRKVFDFLDKWGLINFSAADKKKEVVLGGGDGGGGFPPVVVEDGPPGAVKVVPYPNATKGISLPSSLVSKTGAKGSAGGFKLPPLTSYTDVFGNGKASSFGRVCASCGEQCTSGYYESKRGGFVICKNCFKIENQKGFKSDDFKFNDHVDGSGKVVSNEWTDMETLHLLEAVIAKKNDWALISDQARRSKIDCIARLVQLPLGEPISSIINSKCDCRNFASQITTEQSRYSFNKQNVDTEKKGQAEEEDLEPPQKRRCFSSWPDAVSLMKQVAHLSTIGGPHVASAAAEAAIKALCNETPYATRVFNLKTDEAEVNTEFDSYASNLKDESFAEEREAHKCSEAAEAPDLTFHTNFGHLAFKLRAAIATAFGSAAAHAKMLADQEDREIEHFMASVIEMQVKKIQSKIKHFDELESIMEKEYTQIQQQKESIMTEWIDLLEKANSTGISRWREQGFSKTPRVLAL